MHQERKEEKKKLSVLQIISFLVLKFITDFFINIKRKFMHQERKEEKKLSVLQIISFLVLKFTTDFFLSISKENSCIKKEKKK